jgi:hypothetical protein
MAQEWQELARFSKGSRIVVERVRLPEKEIAIEGEFELPPLAGLSADDQVFVMAFVKSHGSIKQMEKLFGISYPTVKNRLNRIAEGLKLVDVNPPPSRVDILDRLERGEITVDEAVDQLGT